jgi:hypothetical protein
MDAEPVLPPRTTPAGEPDASTGGANASDGAGNSGGPPSAAPEPLGPGHGASPGDGAANQSSGVSVAESGSPEDAGSNIVYRTLNSQDAETMARGEGIAAKNPEGKRSLAEQVVRVRRARLVQMIRGYRPRRIRTWLKASIRRGASWCRSDRPGSGTVGDCRGMAEPPASSWRS